MTEYLTLVIGVVVVPGMVWLSNLHARVGKLETIAENTEKILQLLLQNQLEKK